MKKVKISVTLNDRNRKYTMLKMLGSSGGNVKVVMRLDPLSLFWYILMLLMLVSVILRLMHERKRRQLRIEEPKVVTTLRCCITVKRDFKPGNHILGHGEPCPKCQKPMLIEAVYRIPTEETHAK